MAGNRLAIGAIEIIALVDAHGPFLPLEIMWPSVQADQWEPYRLRYPETLAGARWHPYYNCYLIRSRDRTLLVDTGIGPTPPEVFSEMRSTLPHKLQEHGFDPEMVDTVFLTHLHIDHVGWNLHPDGTPTFPQARYVTSRADWETFQRPEAQARFPPYVDQTLTPLQGLGVLDLLPGETQLADGVTAIPMPGHTPGQMGVRIASEGQQAILVADAIVHPAQMEEPHWYLGVDMDAQTAIATRRALLDWLESDEVTIAAYHFPSPGFGRIVEEGDRRYWEPL